MALYKLEEFAADYRDTEFDNYNIKDFDVYSDIDNDKVGTVKHILVDDSGRFRYLVVDTGFWFFGRQVLLPIGRSRFNYTNRRVYANGLTKEQVENLPDFNDLEEIDYDYEEKVRGVYRTPVRQERLETSTPVDAPSVAHDRNTYRYEQEPNLYDMNERNHQNLKLYEERLVANKSRVKTGEVSVGKHVENETARVSVPVEKERVIIERTTPGEGARSVSPAEADFREGEVTRVDIYEETPDIHKEAVLREEVKINKVVERDTVEAEETLRREELDIDKDDERLHHRKS
ncbi:DUF2382 domain-containing protein [Anabaena sp. FACHB-709]|uniref:PRC-barrel domain-containing protein n=2 Tax=Nostocaceae TaxID=1162 RepID=A0A1Z4KPM3_ANAVA|nr:MULTISPECIES: DUF2382 domain-containing protein [Nostocaceae]BAY70914.1 hypothetical protein NIES23_37250 [Trichormus variabilis NIES-23]HBW31661.1 DUF2382 domain-containing protein [Nostoc sp. UBA8866]MBD2171316.1 DUF2382 domain-containing protein [Anabaena cylindrica FACHB-318]MBD2263014.1 DUF2382 domain-containing protein [Anabaena sp. FACHB-709]MBD2272643.1 DUF2382 domain-containing protein [Nostoc sp. PCC 7120 = FACHB-418]